MTGRKVAFLGGGRMGEALVSGLIRSGGRSADEIMVTCRREERAQEFVDRGVMTRTKAEASQWANVLSSAVGGRQAEPVVTRVVRHMHGDSSGVRGAAWLWSEEEARPPGG